MVMRIKIIIFMMIKGFNFIFKGVNKYQKYCFSSSHHERIQALIHSKQVTTRPEEILQIVKYDCMHHFKNYHYVKTIFQAALRADVYSVGYIKNKTGRDKDKMFEQTLKAATQYPLFQINDDSFKHYYRLIGQTIHQKQNSFLQYCLKFSLSFDSQVMNSPIFIEFIKFYVDDFIELIRAQFSINIKEENVGKTIKLLLFRLFQRGFLPRKPSYSRVLYINDQAAILNTLAENINLHSSLLLKKTNFEMLMKIKEFYEVEMKQNLYHKKNRDIMSNLLIPIVPYLVKSWELKIEIVQEECKYLRELFIKQFLVMERPSLKNSIFMYEAVINHQLKNKQLKEQQTFQTNAKPLTNESFQEQSQNQTNIILEQFMMKVQREFADFTSFSLLQKSQQFSTLQLIYILKHLKTLSSSKQFCLRLAEELEARFSPIFFKKHFQLIASVIGIIFTESRSQQTYSSFYKLFEEEKTYQQLELSQIAEFSSLKICSKLQQIKKALIKSIHKKDIQTIGSQQIQTLLKSYFNTELKEQVCKEHNANRQILIRFVLRFLADHHNFLSFDSNFQEVIRLLFRESQQNNQQDSRDNILFKSFNDEQNNYPLLIHEQLKAHLKKQLWRMKDKSLKLKIRTFYDF